MRFLPSWPKREGGDELFLPQTSRRTASQGGTEYFLSSEAGFQDAGEDNRLRLWTLSTSSSLNGIPGLNLSTIVATQQPYAVPRRPVQKTAHLPLPHRFS